MFERCVCSCIWTKSTVINNVIQIQQQWKQYYTFKKLDNMLISMPESDGQHVLVRERERVVDVLQTLWMAGILYFVKVNNVTLFEHTHTFTKSFNNQWKFELPSGLYLVNKSITCYNTNDSLFNECDSIESIVDMGYMVSISIDGLSLLDVLFIQ